MTNSSRSKMLKWNTILWLTAMVLPAFFSISLANTKFPWPVIVPMLLIGPMLWSNKMLMPANGQPMESQHA